MDVFATIRQQYEFNRGRTLGLLEQIEEHPQPAVALGWRPHPERAHIGWQLMHIGVSEEIFATERLAPDKEPQMQQWWERFRGGSTPDDNPPSPDEIRQVLDAGRGAYLATLGQFSIDQLDEIVYVHPAGNRELSLLTVMNILNWHEAHHQGQAHITWNQYKAQV
ncbi:MAG: DinB family protein [Pirellulaceae bacterium]|jgi:hypothetical protein|nr:DinB family protein [Pirellulaceae bacterium]MDP7019437.1 DinB family protein [Pirellulaceae bacterium]